MGFFKSVVSKFQRSRAKNAQSVLNRRSLKIEPLEDRTLLSAVPAAWSLASVSGTFSEGSSPVVVLNLNSIPQNEVVIGIDFVAKEGSTLEPGTISIYQYDPESGTETDVTDETTFISYEGKFNQESILYAKLTAGEYHLVMTPENDTIGDFAASVFLLGDVDGSGKVDDADYSMLTGRISGIEIHQRGNYSQPTIQLYLARYGIDITQLVEKIYSSLYDLNLDGLLTAADASIAKLNQGTSVDATLTIELDPIGPDIDPVPYTIPGKLDSDDFTLVTVDIPAEITVNCEGEPIDSFKVASADSMVPELVLTVSSGDIYSGREELINYWGISEDDYDTFLSEIAESASIKAGVWGFQNKLSLFDILDADDSLSMTFTYTVRSFVLDGKSYRTSTPGTLTLNVLGTGHEHTDPVGPSSYTGSFDVGTGEIYFNGVGPVLDVMKDVYSPSGYELTASLDGEPTADEPFSVTPGAIEIAPNGTVEIVPEMLAEDFERLRFGETSHTYIDYAVTDTHGGRLDGSIIMTVVGGNHAPQGVTEHTAAVALSTASVVYDGSYTSLNLLSEMEDYDGDAMTVEKTGIINPEGYIVSSSAVTIASAGIITIDAETLKNDFSDLPSGKKAVFTVRYDVTDIHGASTEGEVVVTVSNDISGPQGVKDHTGTIDLRSSTASFDSGSKSLDLLDGVTDAEGLALSVRITKTDAGDYPLPQEAVTQADGWIGVNIPMFQEAFKALPLNETADVVTTFVVSNSAEDSVEATLRLTVVGVNDEPYEKTPLSGSFDISSSVLAFNSGEPSPDVLYGMVDPDGDEMLGHLLMIESPEGYSVSDGAITLETDAKGVQRIVVDTNILADDFDLLPSGETKEVKVSFLIMDSNGKTATRLVSLTVTGAYEPPVEKTVNISLVAVKEKTEGIELKTGSANFGTFYYLPADQVPETDYSQIAGAEEYYLEVWVQDTSYEKTLKQQFITSVQVQLNYDNSLVDSVSMDEICAGKTTFDEYLFYDPWENNLKAFQTTWMFSSEKDWSLMAPITNGKNAYLLARIKVDRNDASSGLSTTITGVSNPESPFVEGWYYVRTGDTDPVDESQISVINVDF